MLSLKFRDQLAETTADELDLLIAALKGLLLVAHDENGNIAAVAASAVNSGTLSAARLPSISQMVLSANTVATVAAATTTYVGTNGENATETIVRMVMPVAGVLRKLYVVAAAVAGAAQSFTYTVRVNGVDTTITCAVSGASATTANDTTHTASVVAGDTVDIKLVTSAGAAAVRHAIGLELATS